MRRIVLVSGILGGGTALVFALAALTASLFPHGTLVADPWNARMGGGVMPMDDLVVRGPAVDVPIKAEPVIEAVP